MKFHNSTPSIKGFNTLGCIDCANCTNKKCIKNIKGDELGMININMRSSIWPIAILGLVGYIVYSKMNK